MRKREPAMEGRKGKRKIRLLTAVLLAAVMVVAMVQLSGADTLNLGENCYLTVNPYQPSSGYENDLAAEKVEIDLYKVASADKITGVDSYGYRLEKAFQSQTTAPEGEETESPLLETKLAPNNLSNLNAEDWRELATEAARIVLTAADTQNPIEPAATVTGGAKSGDLDPGLYLLFVQGSRSDTQTTVPTSGYYYDFGTELVSIPGKNPGEGETGQNTANSGDWNYDMTVNLKASRSPRSTGSSDYPVEIVKTLVPADSGNFKSETFTFHVLITDRNGNRISEDNVDISFDDANSLTQTRPLGRYPEGTVVTVTENSSEESVYTVVGSPTQTKTVETTTLTFEFTNREDTDHQDGSIVNTFTYSSTNGWQWQANPPQAAQ